MRVGFLLLFLAQSAKALAHQEGASVTARAVKRSMAPERSMECGRLLCVPPRRGSCGPPAAPPFRCIPDTAAVGWAGSGIRWRGRVQLDWLRGEF